MSQSQYTHGTERHHTSDDAAFSKHLHFGIETNYGIFGGVERYGGPVLIEQIAEVGHIQAGHGFNHAHEAKQQSIDAKLFLRLGPSVQPWLEPLLFCPVKDLSEGGQHTW